MPRSKTASHEKIVRAAMQEFREKGFARASMKAVASAVDMTPAALYRHFAGKEDMFAALVQPAVDAMNAWKEQHVNSSYQFLEQGSADDMWRFESEYNDARMVLDVIYRQPDAFYLLLLGAAGSPYENYVHDMIEQCVDRMMHFLQQCRSHGFPARPVQRDEMHMLISAYMAALIQPIEHGYDRADAERYLKTMLDFFTPGWRMITGL